MKVLPLLFLACVAFAASDNVRNYPMQAHGFNEVDYIAQLLVKGIDSFKIDIHALDHETCLDYSTWKKTDNKCEKDNWNVNICCLGLRGDTSSSPKLNDYFNTTNDLVAFLNNPKYDFMLHKEKRLPIFNRTVYIAMNVQYDHIEGQLTKDWLYSLTQTITKRNLDIQLIFGGPRTLNYFGDSCKNKTAACDAKAKAILEYPFIIQSSSLDPTPARYGTIANFNIEFPSLPHYCSRFFPSYGDKLPYFFYEISHETDVQFITTTYMSSKCNRSKSHPDMKNIRITSNVDVEMVQAYYPQTNYFEGIKDGTNFLIDTLETDKLAVFSYFDTVSGDTIVQIRSLESSEKLPLISQTKVSKAKYTKMSYRAPYLFLSNQTHAQVFSLTSNPSISLQPRYSISNPGLDGDVVVYKNEAYFLQVEVQGKCAAGTLSFKLTNLNTAALISSACSEQIKAFKVNEIQSGSLAVTSDSNGNLRGLFLVSATYTTFGQAKSAIYAFSLKTTLSDFLPIQASFTVKTPKSFIDLGVDPSIKIINSNGKLYVLEAHSNGICQNGNVFNNGNLYKCGVSSVNNYHYAYLQNVDYLMNYNWGLLDHFEDRIQSGKYVTACDRQIMHGKFYNGEKPSATVFRNPQGDLQALVINQYVNYDRLPFVTRLFGGATMPFSAGTPVSSVVVNAFDILDYNLFTYL